MFSQLQTFNKLKFIYILFKYLLLKLLTHMKVHTSIHIHNADEFLVRLT